MVLAHRVTLHESRAPGGTGSEEAEQVIRDIVESVPVPL